MLDHAENPHYLEVMNILLRKGWVQGDTKNWPRSRIIQINMDLKSAFSLKNDGSRSWTVICRGVNKYVDELREENGEFIYYEVIGYRYGETGCNKTEGTMSSTMTFVSQRCSCQWTNGSGMIFLPSTTSTERSLSYRVSKTLIRIPRHRGFSSRR